MGNAGKGARTTANIMTTSWAPKDRTMKRRVYDRKDTTSTAAKWKTADMVNIRAVLLSAAHAGSIGAVGIEAMARTAADSLSSSGQTQQDLTMTEIYLGKLLLMNLYENS